MKKFFHKICHQYNKFIWVLYQKITLSLGTNINSRKLWFNNWLQSNNINSLSYNKTVFVNKKIIITIKQSTNITISSIKNSLHTDLVYKLHTFFKIDDKTVDSSDFSVSFFNVVRGICNNKILRYLTALKMYFRKLLCISNVGWSRKNYLMLLAWPQIYKCLYFSKQIIPRKTNVSSSSNIISI